MLREFKDLEKIYKDYTYKNGVHYKNIKGTWWKGHMLLVEDPTKIQLVTTEGFNSEGQTVSEMVRNSDALAGVNGGAFVEKSNGGIPSGFVVQDYNIISEEGYHRVIGFDGKGVLRLGYGGTQWIERNNIKHAVTFGPFIVINGEVEKGNVGRGIAPRTVVGQRESGEVIFLVVDGRQPFWSLGIDLKIAQNIMIHEGCINAAMLDGGSSSTMVIGNSVVNKPSAGHERKVNNSWVIMP